MPVDTWTEERIALLTEMWAFGHSATRIGLALDVSRGAVIGKIHRLGLPEPAIKLPVVVDRSYMRQQPEITLQKRRERERRYRAKRREREKYSLEAKREIREQFLAKGTSPYSAAYRKHLPLMPEMSKAQMRDMLAQAIQNTAAR
jgi:hypothetical protein